jgi:hypothetical protein
MSSNSATAAVPASETKAVDTNTAEVMDHVLSSKPEDWCPTYGWLKSVEVALLPSVWHVTFGQWSAAWQAYKEKPQQEPRASPEVGQRAAKVPISPCSKLSKTDLEKIRRKYGASNPYAWPASPVGTAMCTGEQDTATCAHDMSPETVPSNELLESADTHVEARSFPVIQRVHPRTNTLPASCGADTASSFRGERVVPPAPDRVSPQVLVNEDHAQPWQQSKASSLSLLIGTGHAAQRKRGKGPLRTPDHSRDAGELGLAMAAGSKVHARIPPETFLVKNVQRSSLSDPTELAAPLSLKHDNASACKTASRSIRQMRG